MPGVIDEFLLGIKMEGDPSGLVDAYKQIFDLQEEYNRREREQEEEDESGGDKKNKILEGLKKGQESVTSAAGKGVSVLKKGVSVARGWAVALLAVDGAAMAVVGRLSQMSVEYQNVAEATGTSSEKMKAWEDTFKAAGGSADDVRNSLSQLYATARKQMLEGGEDAFAQAMATFDVRMTDESGQMRDTADIFSDLIFSARRMIEGGTDRSVVLQRMAGAGLSESLIAPLMAQNKEGGYRVSQESFQKYYGRTQGMDELADASREISESATELSSVVRQKFTAVLTKMVESGMLTDLMDRITVFIEKIDPEKISEVMDKLISALEKVSGWVFDNLPGAIEGASNIYEVGKNIGTMIAGSEEEKMALRSSDERAKMLVAAIIENLPEGKSYRDIVRESGSGGLFSEGGVGVSENEAIKMSRLIGLNPESILSGMSVNNEIRVYVDGVERPSRSTTRTTPMGASGTGGSTIQ